MTTEPTIERFGRTSHNPIVSVIVLNRNGAGWLPQCFKSIKDQTLGDQIQTIMVDNDSSDDSVAVARNCLEKLPSGALVRNPIGLGYCGGNNSGIMAANGKYALFINNDAWMEPNCVEKLVDLAQRTGAAAVTPWVLNYADNTHQDFGFVGFDLFGLSVSSPPPLAEQEIFIASGCCYFVELAAFRQVGMFDSEFFMYSDEVDLSWRLWIAGHKIVGGPDARVHHRGAAGVNPAGGVKAQELRTTDEKRFLNNRNCLLTILKNGKHILLLTLIPQVLLLLAETMVGCVLLRRLSFAKTTFIAALRDCWRLRHHVRNERKKIAAYRQHSDFWMLQFFKWRLNRWDEINRIRKFGLPRVDANFSAQQKS